MLVFYYLRIINGKTTGCGNILRALNYHLLLEILKGNPGNDWLQWKKRLMIGWSAEYCLSSLWQEYGKLSEIAKLSVSNDKLVILNSLKVRSILIRNYRRKMKQLEDGRTLQDYNIHNGVFVDMNYQQVSN